MPLSRITAIAWIAFGIMGVSFVSFMWAIEGFDIGKSANLSYIIVIGFFLAATGTGIAAKRGHLWAKFVITILSTFLLLYCIFYLGFIRTSFGRFPFFVMWILFLFSLLSTVGIWTNRKRIRP